MQSEVFCVPCVAKPKSAYYTGHAMADPPSGRCASFQPRTRSEKCPPATVKSNCRCGRYVGEADEGYAGMCAFSCMPQFYYHRESNQCRACEQCGLGQYPSDPSLICTPEAPKLGCVDCDFGSIPLGAFFTSRYDPTCPWQRISNGTLLYGQSAAYVPAKELQIAFDKKESEYDAPDLAGAEELRPVPLSDLRALATSAGGRGRTVSLGSVWLLAALALIWR